MFKRIILLALFLPNVGCVTSINDEGAAPGVRIDDPNAPFATAQIDTVVVLDRALSDLNGRGKIAVEATGAERTSTGTLEVWANLRNRTQYDLQVEARVSFFDSNLRPVEQTPGWKRLFLPPNSLTGYSDLSLRSDRIDHYLIEIREGR